MVDSDSDERWQSEFQWIVHGHVVMSTRNPCLPDLDEDDDRTFDQCSDTCNLGCGLIIKLNHILAVDQAGMVVHVGPARDFYATISEDKCRLHPGYLRLSPTSFLCPGLIDLHIHAPQYAFSGTGTDRPLMGPEGWLETYTFPTEAGMRDVKRARRVYEAVVKHTEFGD